MLATIRDIPTGLELNEGNVTKSIDQFSSSLAENGVYGQTRVTAGGSFGDPMDTVEVFGLTSDVSLVRTGSNIEIAGAIADQPDVNSPGATMEADRSSSSHPDEDPFSKTGNTITDAPQPETSPPNEPVSSNDRPLPYSHDTEGTSPSRNGCYIATAVYGGYDMPQVRVLRRFRDDTLRTTGVGRATVRIYYILSPMIVRRLGSHSWFLGITRPVLDAMVSRLRSSGTSDSTYSDSGQ
jgi:hypothetical protein